MQQTTSPKNPKFRELKSIILNTMHAYPLLQMKILSFKAVSKPNLYSGHSIYLPRLFNLVFQLSGVVFVFSILNLFFFFWSITCLSSFLGLPSCCSVSKSCLTLYNPIDCNRASLVAQMVKRLPAVQETRVRFLDSEDPLGKEMATHSSTLAWKIPWTEEPGRLQSMGSQRVRHD